MIFFKLYLVSLIVFFAIDLFWLGIIAKNLYREQIGFLILFAISLGLLQETVFIQSGILAYPNGGIFPPLWLLALYPLFSLTLNSSLTFLNKNLLLTFFLGGFGALLSYLSGERLGGVQLFPPLAYPGIFLSWGVFLTVLIILNRKLMGFKGGGL